MNGEEMEELKEGWRRVRLGDVIDFNPKETLKKNTMSKYVEMAQLQCFARNIIGYSFKEYKGGTKFRNGDTLLARITPCLENGKTAFVDILEEDEVGFGSTEYIVLRKKEGYTDENYIFYLAISDLFRQIAIKSMTGTSGRQRVQTEVLKNSEIVIPEVNIQKKIASILSLLDEKIELNRKINQNLEEIAQTLFKRWFIDFEFPNEEGKPYKSSGGKMIESELGEIPEGWKIKNLLEVGDFINGLAMQKYRPLDTEDSLKVIKIKEMNSGFSKESELCSVNIPDTYKVNFGDILFSWSGTLKVMFWNKECGGLNQHIFKVIPKNVNKLFLYFWLKIHLQTFIQIAQSKATTMGHIKRNDLNNSKIIVPNTEFWIYKEKILNSYLEKIVYQSKEIEKLIELRDYLLPKLMNGEIDVSNLKISKILNSDLSFYLIQFFHLIKIKLKQFFLAILNHEF